MAENAPHHDPKLSEFDIIFGTILMASLDLGDWLEAGVPLTDILGFPLEQVFLKQKGIKGTTALVGNLLELAPFVDYLPLRTAAFLITAWMDHHPSALTEKMEQAGEIEQGLEGKGTGAVGAEGQAAAAAGGEAAAAQGGGGATGGTPGASGGTGGGAGTEGQSGKGSKEGSQGADGSSPEGSGGKGEDKKDMSLEERRKDNAVKGRDIENLEEDFFNPEAIDEDIEREASGEEESSKFDPGSMGPEMNTKGASEESDGGLPPGVNISNQDGRQDISVTGEKNLAIGDVNMEGGSDWNKQGVGVKRMSDEEVAANRESIREKTDEKEGEGSAARDGGVSFDRISQSGEGTQNIGVYDKEGKPLFEHRASGGKKEFGPIHIPPPPPPPGGEQRV